MEYLLTFNQFHIVREINQVSINTIMKFYQLIVNQFHNMERKIPCIYKHNDTIFNEIVNNYVIFSNL